MKVTDYHIILASGSPRRQQLLTEVGLEYELRLKEVSEELDGEFAPEAIAEQLALKKSSFYQNELSENELLITADTTVVLNGEVLNKPKDYQDARSMLQKLSGANHQVITGVALTSAEKQASFSAVTHVYFKVLSTAEIDHYIQAYQPFDKAGAYGIQEWIGHIGIERIEGSYFNVVGLPTFELLNAIEQF